MGSAAVPDNGYHPERAVQTGIGLVINRVPKVQAKAGKPVIFQSAPVHPFGIHRSRAALALAEKYFGSPPFFVGLNGFVEQIV